MLFRKIIRYYLERVGKHGKIIKTIKLCGLLGITKDSVTGKEELSKSESVNKTEKPKKLQKIVSGAAVNEYDKEITEFNMINYPLFTLFNIFFKIIFYRSANIILLLVRFVFSLVITTGRMLSNINGMLLLTLTISMIINLFLSGRSTVSYWTVKRAEKTFQNFAEKNNQEVQVPTSKSIYIKDLDILTRNLATELDNPVYMKFNEDESSKDSSYQETRTELAIRRNQLLVELKILQNMEREVVQGNYRRFLIKELDSCNAAMNELPDMFKNDSNLQSYCVMCSTELDRLTELLL